MKRYMVTVGTNFYWSPIERKFIPRKKLDVEDCICTIEDIQQAISANNKKRQPKSLDIKFIRITKITAGLHERFGGFKNSVN